MNRENIKLLIVGNPQQEHVGAHFLSAAHSLGWAARIMDLRDAWSRGGKWIKRFHYHLLKKRPTAFNTFSKNVVDECHNFVPDILLSTGIAPISASALEKIGKLGVKRTAFLTDDPWNPKNGAGFFWKSLKQYDAIFNPRLANMDQLQTLGCSVLSYLPFAYNPDIHFYEPPETRDEVAKAGCDVAIVGGADKDRFPLARAVLNAGLSLKLYGGYWDKEADLKSCWHGFVYGRDLRMAVAGAKVNLVMGRKTNRDGHAMRSLEVPAMRGCVLAENSKEHRALYGDNDVQYYGNIEEMVEKASALIKKNQSKQMARILNIHVVNNGHTYKDRLISISNEVLNGD